MAFVSQSNASGALVNDIKDYVVNTEVQVLSDEVLEASDRATSSESHSDNDTEHSGRSEEAAGQFAERNVNVKGDNDAVRLSPSAENEANVLTAIKVLQVVATYGAHGDTVWLYTFGDGADQSSWADPAHVLWIWLQIACCAWEGVG
jgi:hypothetical protein